MEVNILNNHLKCRNLLKPVLVKAMAMVNKFLEDRTLIISGMETRIHKVLLSNNLNFNKPTQPPYRGNKIITHSSLGEVKVMAECQDSFHLATMECTLGLKLKACQTSIIIQ